MKYRNTFLTKIRFKFSKRKDTSFFRKYIWVFGKEKKRFGLSFLGIINAFLSLLPMKPILYVDIDCETDKIIRHRIKIQKRLRWSKSGLYWT